MSLCDSQFQLAPCFSEVVQFLAFPIAAAEFLHPAHLHILPLSPGRGEMFPLYIWPPVLSRGGAINSPAVLAYVDASQAVCCTYLVS
jgi:hypothetical protein